MTEWRRLARDGGKQRGKYSRVGEDALSAGRFSMLATVADSEAKEKAGLRSPYQFSKAYTARLSFAMLSFARARPAARSTIFSSARSMATDANTYLSIWPAL